MMLNTLGIVQIRREYGSSVLKVARKLGDKSLLELVVRRVTDCQRLDGVVVLADGQHDDQICQLVPSDVPVFRPTQKDALAAFAAVVGQYEAKSAVRVCADNPFVDPVLIDRLVSTADANPQCDYISYCRADGRPAIMTELGVFAEWCSAIALRRADRQAKHRADRDQVTAFLHAHPEWFSMRLIPLPPELDRDDLRLKIDFEEDWEHAQAVYEALGPDEWDWRRIADLLDHQPALRQRMAILNRGTTPV